MNIIEIKNLFFGYEKKNSSENFLLENINLNINDGEIVSILGPNGSGKTTLLRLISGFLSPGKGEIKLNARNIKDYKQIEIARFISFVSQINEVIFPYSVFNFVSMGRNPFKINSYFENENDLKIIEKYLDMFELKSISHKTIDKISGGELQRAYLCRALVQEPKILLMDEPVSHLDIKHQLNSYKLLKELNGELGLTIILVSHDLNLSLKYSDRIILIKDGKIVFNSKSEELNSTEIIKEIFEVDTEIIRNKNDETFFLLS